MLTSSSFRLFLSLALSAEYQKVENEVFAIASMDRHASVYMIYDQLGRRCINISTINAANVLATDSRFGLK